MGVGVFATCEGGRERPNATGYGVSRSIYTTNPQNAFRFRERITAGMVSVNNSTSGAEAHLPFGGNGKSGNGSRQAGQWVLDQFTRWPALNWDYSGRPQKGQMDVAELPPDREFRLGPEPGTSSQCRPRGGCLTGRGGPAAPGPARGRA